MTKTNENSSATLSHEASWALAQLAQQRYGRDAPVLSWSIRQELIRAGFVSVPQAARNVATITPAGHHFLLVNVAR